MPLHEKNYHESVVSLKKACCDISISIQCKPEDVLISPMPHNELTTERAYASTPAFVYEQCIRLKHALHRKDKELFSRHYRRNKIFDRVIEPFNRSIIDSYVECYKRRGYHCSNAVLAMIHQYCAFDHLDLK